MNRKQMGEADDGFAFFIVIKAAGCVKSSLIIIWLREINGNFY